MTETKLYLHIEEDLWGCRVLPAARRAVPQTRPVYLTKKQVDLFRAIMRDPSADPNGCGYRSGVGLSTFIEEVPRSVTGIAGYKKHEFYPVDRENNPPLLYRLKVKTQKDA